MGVARGSSLGRCGASEAPRQGACTLVDVSLPPFPHRSDVPIGTEGVPWVLQVAHHELAVRGGGGGLKLTGHELYHSRG